MTTTLPTVADVATLPAERLNELAAMAMGWRRDTGGHRWITADGGARYTWHPYTDANQAVEVAERVLAEDGWSCGAYYHGPPDERYVVSSGRELTSQAPAFAEALTRAAVAAWVARQG